MISLLSWLCDSAMSGPRNPSVQAAAILGPATFPRQGEKCHDCGDLELNTTPDPESSLVKMSESGHFTAINLIKQCD